jgi:glycyl-tRNA synthetase
MASNLMEKIVSLCKHRGFIFPSSEIYGGIGGFWDYGPLGVLLKNNIKSSWWKEMVQLREDIVGLDSSIIMNPRVWEASGHVESFTDPLVDCRQCKKRFRADNLIENMASDEEGVTTQAEIKKLEKLLAKIKCPECGGELTKPRRFNLLVPTYLGVVEDESTKVYLRGETCQGIYADYQQVKNSMRMKIPFGIAQIGKAFRNEITFGDFTFRSREFEQMEMQYFIEPKQAQKWFNFWKEQRIAWYINLGMKKNNIRFRKHTKEERPHYARDAGDIEYKTPFGWKEFEGIHNRSDWDLSRHSKYSGKDLSYFDEDTKKRYIPWIIETSGGIDRATLMFLINAYCEVKGGRTTTTESIKEKEVVLKLHKDLSPIKTAVLPLLRKDRLIKKAKEVYDLVKTNFISEYDEVGSIGKRYRRQDEIGTPYCVTIDFDTLDNKDVTIRDRDTMEQERIKIEKLTQVLKEKLE